jgi:RND family efflux transporter MFP subunit
MRREPLLFLLVACTSQAPPPSSPVKVENARKETELTTVTLTEKAEQRLGVKIAAVERRAVDRARTYGGEIAVPKGKSIQVAAPVAGTITGAPGMAAGATVRRGQVVLRLAALPSSSDLASAGVRLEPARKKVERAQRLLEAGAGSQRALDEARAELDLAEAASRPRGGGALAIESPQAGVIRELLVGPGQTVAAGAPLFHVDAAETLWVRVPVYVGELGAVDRGRPARVRPVSAPPGQPGLEAPPVQAPPSADPIAATSDLFFQLPAADTFRPGQKVEVSLPLAGAGEERLVVPWSAVVHDISGGAWVYENRTPHVYSRRRVEIERVVGPWAVLGRGPMAGTRVVAVGAAEIYGAEFGGK